MYLKQSDIEFVKFIESEMMEEILFQNATGRELKVSYKDFFTSLCKRKALASHLELVSCVTTINEFYPIIYDCFLQDYGHVNFDIYPKSLKKFSPVLFTLCLDFISNKGIIISREYLKHGKDIAFLEKLLYTEIHYTKQESAKVESVYYKDFLTELLKQEEFGAVREDILAEAQAILVSASQKIEFSEDVILLFHELFGDIVSNQLKIDNLLHSNYVGDLRFMLSSVGIYTCLNHLKKVGDISVLLPVLYTKSSNQHYDSKPGKRRNIS